jgi:hypothetical protein
LSLCGVNPITAPAYGQQEAARARRSAGGMLLAGGVALGLLGTFGGWETTGDGIPEVKHDPAFTALAVTGFVVAAIGVGITRSPASEKSNLIPFEKAQALADRYNAETSRMLANREPIPDGYALAPPNFPLDDSGVSGPGQ